MKRFYFSLQKVLDYNDHIQKQEAETMSRLQAEYRTIEVRRESLIQSHHAQSLRFQADCATGQTAGQTAAISAYLYDLTCEIDRSSAALAKQGERVEAQRKRLTAATKDKKIFEKLRAHSLSDYQATARKGEGLFIEEFLANRAARAKL